MILRICARFRGILSAEATQGEGWIRVIRGQIESGGLGLACCSPQRRKDAKEDKGERVRGAVLKPLKPLKLMEPGVTQKGTKGKQGEFANNGEPQ